MRKSANIFIAMILAATTIGCDSTENDDADVTIRVYSPEVSREGVSAKVEYLNPKSGSFEFLAQVGMNTLDDAFFNAESIRGVTIEVGDSDRLVPVFATTVFLDGMMSEKPLKLRVPVSVDDVLKVRMKLVGEDEEKAYPEALAEIVAAQEMAVTDQEIVPIRE
jgi:hypothetical protein